MILGGMRNGMPDPCFEGTEAGAIDSIGICRPFPAMTAAAISKVVAGGSGD